MDAVHPLGVFGGGVDQLLRIHSADLRDFFCRTGDMGAVVALAAKRHGAEVRRVGFEQQTVERHRRGDLDRHTGVFERHGAAERDVHPELHDLFEHFDRPGIAVHQALGAVLSEQRHHVAVRLAVVDDDGRVEVFRKL